MSKRDGEEELRSDGGGGTRTDEGGGGCHDWVIQLLSQFSTRARLHLGTCPSGLLDGRMEHRWIQVAIMQIMLSCNFSTTLENAGSTSCYLITQWRDLVLLQFPRYRCRYLIPSCQSIGFRIICIQPPVAHHDRLWVYRHSVVKLLQGIVPSVPQVDPGGLALTRSAESDLLVDSCLYSA